MSDALPLATIDDQAVEIRQPNGALLMRYVFRPDTAASEAPRPYAHPVCSLAGEVLTNFRPNDHPWHHALSFTITSLAGRNFWGGGTYRSGEGYQDLKNQGTQHHVEWLSQTPEKLSHVIEWRAGEEVLLREVRTLTARIESAQTWSLRWQAELVNVTGQALTCASYHSGEGLSGSHYTGLQFRGARDLLDEHGDDSIGIFASPNLQGEKAVHGTAADWMEWRARKDTTLRRVTLRFANATGPLHWFVRRHNPLMVFPFHYERNHVLLPGAVLRIDHSLTITDQ